ncbi:MAG: transposase [Candidatus Hydrogenedentes bacterium]|nr:transposase [Candidatus Hydrogenedentota bacterium]
MDSIEVADVFRQFAPSYIEAFGKDMLPSHRRAIKDIIACRTQAMGGHVYQCDDCGEHFHVYHGCRNRSCPACHTRQTAQWLEERNAELLPCPYYHVCVTVPEELREVFRANQSACYGLLMKAAAEAVRTLCSDKRYMGATPAILAVLHTWTARMDYHPHVHMLVSGGGLCDDGVTWREARHRFLFPVRALSKLVRGKIQAWFKKKHPDLLQGVPKGVWNKKWVAWCQQWGEGETAVLDYLARYVHRIAIANARILKMDEHTVTFCYKERKKAKWRTCTLKGHEFMRRFLQHVLPKGLHKVRYYGLWHPKKRGQRENARFTLLLARAAAGKRSAEQLALDVDQPENDVATTQEKGPICPHCKSTNTRLLGPVKPQQPKTKARASPQKSC